MNKLIEAIKKFITQYYSYLFSFLIFVLLIFGIFKGKVELNIIRFAIAFLLLDIVIEVMAKHEILGAGDVAFEHAVLYPLAEVL